jgi:uncharacterized protein YkwD
MGGHALLSALTVRRLTPAIVVAGALLCAPAAGSASVASDHRAAASSASCADTKLIPAAGNLDRIEAATLCLVNVQRTRHGERALRANADLDRSAARHSQDMVAENYFDHVSPAGETLLDRIKASTYLPSRSAYVVGENIALGTLQLATPAAIVASWMRSSGHRANILNADFRDSGIGVVAKAPRRYSNGQRGATYTQQFGAIARR